MNKIQKQKDKAYKAYLVINNPAEKAYKAIKDPAWKAYLAKFNEIEAQEPKVCLTCGK